MYVTSSIIQIYYIVLPVGKCLIINIAFWLSQMFLRMIELRFLKWLWSVSSLKSSINVDLSVNFDLSFGLPFRKYALLHILERVKGHQTSLVSVYCTDLYIWATNHGCKDAFSQICQVYSILSQLLMFRTFRGITCLQRNEKIHILRKYLFIDCDM